MAVNPRARLTGMATANGMMKVSAPKVSAWDRRSRNSSRSSSNPAWNMRYSSPALPSTSTVPSRSNRPNAEGPIRMPAPMSPMIDGMRTARAASGAISTRTNSSARTRAGSNKGVEKAAMCLGVAGNLPPANEPGYSPPPPVTRPGASGRSTSGCRGGEEPAERLPPGVGCLSLG